MNQNCKKQMILPSLLTLLPAALGLVLRLWRPEWYVSGLGFGGKSMDLFLFLMPVILLPLLWLCAYITEKDPGNRGRNQKTASVMLWIIPILSNFVAALMLSIVLKGGEHVLPLSLLSMGALFSVIGNFMPKTKRNATIGIKIHWTLASDENWNATHRFAGRLWFLLGIGLMLFSGISEKTGMWVLIAVLLLMVLAPIAYSGLFYRKQKKAGTAPDLKQVKDLYGTLDPRFTKASLAILALILLGVGVLMFTGRVECTFRQDSFTVKGTYYSGLTLSYEDIDSLEFRETEDRGTRAMGWGSPRLLLGTFENDEFGTYTRYSYTNCGSCVVLRSGGQVLVLSGKDDAETRAIYDTLAEKNR